MGRTRLFHTIVIVGAGLLASCEKGPKPIKKKDAAFKDAGPAAAKIIAEPPDPPRIHAMTPEKMGEVDPQPPPPMIVAAPPPPLIQSGSVNRRNQRPVPKAPKTPRI
ncbi:MAG TPA: hypothetical protein VL326_02550 [Kofleriaceae bacterium]|nr:hypothetical protein [Kofleriaceae bacterium]